MLMKLTVVLLENSAQSFFVLQILFLNIIRHLRVLLSLLQLTRSWQVYVLKIRLLFQIHCHLTFYQQR